MELKKWLHRNLENCRYIKMCIRDSSYTVRRWRLGAYIRLSKEDLKKVKDGKDDSNSVKNQRDLLGDFYFKHQNEFESIAEYVDDGHTGTDANREDF